jgi:hypothetical protein
VQSGTLDINNMSASQSRVYNVLGTADWKEIRYIENGGFNNIVIDETTKYPLSKTTVMKIIENYEKTSSSTFDPKQSDKHFFYSPSTGTVVTADLLAQYDTLNAKLINGTDGQGNALSYTTEWIDLTESEEALFSIMNAEHKKAGETTYYFYFPEAEYNWDTQKITFQTEDGEKILKRAIMLRTNTKRIEENGEQLTIEGLPEDRKTYYTPNNSNVSEFDDKTANFYGRRTGFRFQATYTLSDIEQYGDMLMMKRMAFEMEDGSVYYSQIFYTKYNDVSHA